MLQYDPSPHLTPKIIAVITDREEVPRLRDILTEKHIFFQYMFHARGTASSDILETFGLSASEKEVCVCILPRVKVNTTMRAISERLEFMKPGNGIIFSLPVSGTTGAIANAFVKEEKQWTDKLERLDELMEKEMERIAEQTKYELIVSMINQGYSEELMNAAKKAGARGGTIVHARRAGIEDAVKFFGVSLQEEKEVVAIVAPKQKKKELMQAICQACGIATPARGIIFSMPVESLYGIEMEGAEEQ